MFVNMVWSIKRIIGFCLDVDGVTKKHQLLDSSIERPIRTNQTHEVIMR